MSWRCLSKARRQPRSQKIAESLFAKYIRIALAIFRKFDDSYGYTVAGVKTAPVSLNSLASHFECNAHDPRRFRVKLLVASQPKPISCRPATDGCMRSSAMSFGVIARKNGAQVRLYSHPGNDLTHRFPLIVETLAQLRSRSCIIDGEAVACDDNGVALFDLIRYHRANDRIFLYAFDLIELNGDDLRRDPLEVRKATLASIVAKAQPGIRFNEHIEGDGPTVFAHACKIGLEGIGIEA